MQSDEALARSTPGAAWAHGLLADARGLLADIVATRRRLHRTPEVGLDLPATQAFVVEDSRRSAWSRAGPDDSSVTAVIEGARPGPTILLRADMDGLPLTRGDRRSTSRPSEPARCTPAATTPTWRCSLGAARLLVDRRGASSPAACC